MIVLDANLLLYAYDSSAPNHRRAHAWIEQTFSDGSLIGIPWQTVYAFLRIVTNSNLPGQRFSAPEAVEIVDRWLEQPNVRLLAPGENHWGLLRQTIVAGQARGRTITDAQLAAITLEYGGELCTTDRDFARFPNLRWSNPLESTQNQK
jgi:uncharacterized protein